MSATFNEDVHALKELVLHNPVRAPWDRQETQRTRSCLLKGTLCYLGLEIPRLVFLVLRH